MLTDSEAKRQRAYEMYCAKNHQASIECCLTAIVGSPWQPWCYYLMGINFLAMGRKEAARASLARYMDLEKANFSTTRKKAASILTALARKT